LSYMNWPIRAQDRPRLQSLLTKLASKLGKKLSYVDVATLLFDNSDIVVDAITTAESVVSNPGLKGSVPA